MRPIADMSGWLAYHAVFVASVSAALYRCQTDPQRLARERGELLSGRLDEMLDR